MAVYLDCRLEDATLSSASKTRLSCYRAGALFAVAFRERDTGGVRLLSEDGLPLPSELPRKQGAQVLQCDAAAARCAKSAMFTLWSRDGTIVPRVDSVRILGLWIDARGCNGGAIERLGGQASNILRLISPITKLGLHNTVDELIEAHFAAQMARLSSTKAGLKILDEAGIASPRVEVSDGVQLTRDEREDIQAVARIEPVLFFEVQVAMLKRRFLWTLLSTVRGGRAFGVSVVDGKGQLVARASAAEVPCVVYSDSRLAVQAFSGGLISQQAARLLRSGRRQARWAGGHISWFPAHVEGTDRVNPNASAHTLAREYTNRAGGGEASGGTTDLRKDPLTAFHEITSNYKLCRRRFPLPNASLNRAQGITFRLLQTDTYLCPRTYRRIAPDIQEECPRCGLESCSLTDMLWQCPANASGQAFLK
ncbi:hypothetical protein HPB50_006169 [Hyalomma asiaticum]|uniref:Uncharacterized protein n=1 Tax=Hyalomma asiaticum TaxID=266040 RepID=A0ACB7TDM0_HYAAI|nr:hypothetical protein HPB50_006169 [Hyalomma asiaticum]